MNYAMTYSGSSAPVGKAVIIYRPTYSGSGGEGALVYLHNIQYAVG